MITKVVNICVSPYDVYIGRTGKGKDGYFGNPFSMKYESEREKVLTQYKEYFLDRIENDNVFRQRILGLKGKVLGCFCHPKSCHGDIIVDWINKETNE